VDILRGELAIEIQTGSFSNAARKLRGLVEQHPVRLVYPIARESLIVKRDARGRAGKPRRSPRRLGYEQVFDELVSFPDLLAHENFELELVLVRQEEVRELKKRPPRRRRRLEEWRTVERRLVDVLDRLRLRTPDDLRTLLPADLPDPFHTLDLARALNKPRWLAQKVAYCLRKSGAAADVGRAGRSRLYSMATETVRKMD